VCFVWDETKDRANRRKHGMSFATARLVFDDPLHLSVFDGHHDGEERWKTFGMVGSVVILLVVHTHAQQDDGDVIIRIISARKATKRERDRYEESA
jgi:hypothetical protein